MRVFITGAAGFIGSYLVEHHLQKGDDVCGLDNFSSGTPDNINKFSGNPKFRFIEADIVTYGELDKLAEWADRIYHMAAVVGVYKVLQEPTRVLAVNIAGCERIFRAMVSVAAMPRVIIASSSEVYGPNTPNKLSETTNLIIESAAKNRWHYAVSKLADESFALAYHRKFNIPATIIRLFNTTGPRQTGRYGMVVPRFVTQAIENQPINVYGDGQQTRSFCDVRDTVKMLDLLADTPKSIGEVVNVGNDNEITINELANLVKKVANSNSPIMHTPYNEAYGEEYIDIQRRCPDLSKLHTLVNFKQHWTLEDSIRDTIKYKKSNL